MPIPDSETNEHGEGVYTLLLIIAAVFFLVAVSLEYMELSSEYHWLGGEKPTAEGFQ